MTKSRIGTASQRITLLSREFTPEGPEPLTNTETAANETMEIYGRSEKPANYQTLEIAFLAILNGGGNKAGKSNPTRGTLQENIRNPHSTITSHIYTWSSDVAEDIRDTDTEIAKYQEPKLGVEEGCATSDGAGS